MEKVSRSRTRNQSVIPGGPLVLPRSSLVLQARLAKLARISLGPGNRKGGSSYPPNFPLLDWRSTGLRFHSISLNPPSFLT